MPTLDSSALSALAHDGERDSERLVARQLEDRGFAVHNANRVLGLNCQNIDLVVYSQTGAIYVQVKSSRKPAKKGYVTIDGAYWRLDQLYEDQPIYNQHRDGFQAAYIVIVDVSDATGRPPVFYVAPPKSLEREAVKLGRIWYEKPTEHGTQRRLFPKDLPISLLEPWRDRWDLLGKGSGKT